MAVPAFASLQRYIGKLLTNTNWDFNFQTIVNWLADGTTDLNVANVTGTAISGTTGTFSSTVTATSFIGSGASLTGINSTIGQISMYGGTTDPANWLICDGRQLSRTGVYADLFAVIGESFGEGDNSTTFNIPDLRSAFVRGVSFGSISIPNGEFDTVNHRINHASHGLNRNGRPVRFTGTLPGDLATGTTYYTRTLTSGTFELYDTRAHAIDTSGTTGRFAITAGAAGTPVMVDYSDPDYATRLALSTGGGTGANVGSFELDALASHTHNYGQQLNTGFATGSDNTIGNNSNTQATSATGGTETRPINVAVNFIIRYS